MNDVLKQDIAVGAKVVCIEKIDNSFSATAHMILGVVEKVTPKTCTVALYNDDGTPRWNSIKKTYATKTFREESRSVLVHNW